MMDAAFHIGFGAVLAAMVLGLWRMFVGPSVVDRILAFDFLVVCTVAMIALLSLRWGTAMYVELILILAMLGFFSTVALMRYLDRVLPPGGNSGEEGDS